MKKRQRQWIVRTTHGLAVFVAWLVFCASVHAAPTVVLREVTSGLSLPVEILLANDGSNRFFVVEQGGRIRILQNGALLPTPFLDISSGGVIDCCSERGLLGLAFHPQFANNRAFYIFYTAPGGALTIARYFADTVNPNVAVPNSDPAILSIPHASFGNHNGGHIAFGPDGYLYIATGDGGSGGDPERNSLNLRSRLGKLLRIAVDGGPSYTIPATNPHIGQTCATACPEIWAYGLRNPWKFSFDRVTGDLFIGDVGQGAVEEVNFQSASSIGNTNYGWGVFEGNNCFNNSYFGTTNACATLAGHTPPIVTYGHDSAGGFSITGGFRYRGARSIALNGYYLYADFSSKRIWAARPNALGTWVPEVLIPPPASLASISSFGEDANGELYLLDYGNGKVWALDAPDFGLLGLQSQRQHGAQLFSVEVNRNGALTNTVSVEPREIHAAPILNLQFNQPVTATGLATIRDLSGTTLGVVTLTPDGNQLRATLPPVADQTNTRIVFSGVNNTEAQFTVGLGFLVGDLNHTGRVTAADISAMKRRVNQPITTDNARFDLNGDGVIDNADLQSLKLRAGRSLQ